MRKSRDFPCVLLCVVQIFKFLIWIWRFQFSIDEISIVNFIHFQVKTFSPVVNFLRREKLCRRDYLDYLKNRAKSGDMAVLQLTFRNMSLAKCPKIDPATGVIEGGPEPLENEINKILGSKREDRFSDHFSDLVQNICSVRFSYLLHLSIFCKAPRDMRKFPQKCQKTAGCWESAVYGSRPLIASKPDSSPPERPDLDNITSQPWSEATCPSITSASAHLRFVTIFLLEKTR